jgi:cysteine desulfurase
MIYLDHNATTPLDPRVLDAMLPYFKERFGNAASRHHAAGREAAEAVERARAQVASLLGADPRELVWTSGATESVNLALQGVFAAPAHAAKGDHLVTAATEHRAVLDVAAALEKRGVRVTRLGVDRDGKLDLDRLAAAITDRTVLVSIMHANNETGVLHPLREIGALCRAKGALFHTDATQSLGKEPIDLAAVDLLSASAHKLHGPKGAGLLWVRRRDPHVRVEPLIHGGGHERGLRSGTLNVPAIVGFGAAAELAAKEPIAPRARRDRLEAALLALGDVVPNGAEPRLATTTNLSFSGIDAEALIKAVPEVAVSTSSACTSATLQPSYVLGALGCDEARIRGSVRFSLGRFTTDAEVDRAARLLGDAVCTLR